MEKLKNVHDHKLTDILKVLIFTLVMLLPGIVFIPSCLYYGFNEHAVNTETTDITYKYQSNEVTTLDDLVEGHIYHLDQLSLIEDTDLAATFEIKVLQVKNIQTPNNNYDEYAVDRFDECYFIFNYENGQDLSLTINFTEIQDDSYIYMYDMGLTTRLTNCEFIYNNAMYNYFVEYDILPTYTNYNRVENIVVNTDNTISTQISRNWTQMWQQPMFNWTNNTPLNTGLNSFISIFGINQQSCISNLLIWLLSMTAIYVVIDIVLGVFKWLTHMIGNK